MNWDAIGAVGEILGAAGVIITLIYLSGQIRQSNRQIRGEAIANLAQLTQTFAADVRDNRELFRIAVAAAHDWNSNTEDDRNRAHLLNLQEFQLLETAFHLEEQGAIPTELYAAREDYMLGRLADPGTRHWWDSFTYNLDERFVDRLNEKLQLSSQTGVLTEWAGPSKGVDR
jgi:hypothetical protein